MIRNIENVQKHCCSNSKCIQKKHLESINKKYNVENISQIKGVSQKVQKTMREKRKENPKFGLPEISPLKDRERIKQGMIKKYGVDHPMKNKEIKRRRDDNFEAKYGVRNPKQVKDFVQKAINTAYNNSSFISSKAQRYVCELLDLELNYPCLKYAIDMADLKNKIALEWDGSGHNLSVKMGHISQSSFDRNSNYRKKQLYSEGWKIFTIISSKDKIPNDEIIVKVYEKVKYYFNNNFRHWFEYNVEENKIKCSVCEIDLNTFIGVERLNELTSSKDDDAIV